MGIVQYFKDSVVQSTKNLKRLIAIFIFCFKSNQCNFKSLSTFQMCRLKQYCIFGIANKKKEERFFCEKIVTTQKSMLV